MNVQNLLLEPATETCAYDEGVQAYWDGKQPEMVAILYKLNSMQYFEWLSGWTQACQYDVTGEVL